MELRFFEKKKNTSFLVFTTFQYSRLAQSRKRQRHGIGFARILILYPAPFSELFSKFHVPLVVSTNLGTPRQAHHLKDLGR